MTIWKSATQQSPTIDMRWPLTGVFYHMFQLRLCLTALGVKRAERVKVHCLSTQIRNPPKRERGNYDDAMAESLRSKQNIYNTLLLKFNLQICISSQSSLKLWINRFTRTTIRKQQLIHVLTFKPSSTSLTGDKDDSVLIE